LKTLLQENEIEDKEIRNEKKAVEDDVTSDRLGKRRSDEAVTEQVQQSGSIRNPFLRPVKKLKTKKKP